MQRQQPKPKRKRKRAVDERYLVAPTFENQTIYLFKAKVRFLFKDGLTKVLSSDLCNAAEKIWKESHPNQAKLFGTAKGNKKFEEVEHFLFNEFGRIFWKDYYDNLDALFNYMIKRGVLVVGQDLPNNWQDQLTNQDTEEEFLSNLFKDFHRRQRAKKAKGYASDEKESSSYATVRQKLLSPSLSSSPPLPLPLPTPKLSPLYEALAKKVDEAKDPAYLYLRNRAQTSFIAINLFAPELKKLEQATTDLQAVIEYSERFLIRNESKENGQRTECENTIETDRETFASLLRVSLVENFKAALNNSLRNNSRESESTLENPSSTPKGPGQS